MMQSVKADPQLLIITRDEGLLRQVETTLGKMSMPYAHVADPRMIRDFLTSETTEIALVDTRIGMELVEQVCIDIRKVAGPDRLAILVVVGEEMGDAALTSLLFAGADGLVGHSLKPLSFKARIRAHLSRIAAAKKLALRVHDSEVLIDVTSRLVGSADILDNLYDVAVLIAKELDVNRCSVVLVRPQGDFGLVVASSDDPELRSLAINLKRYPEIARAVERGQPLIIDDILNSELLAQVLPSMRQVGISSVALFPIARQGEVLGVIFLRFSDRRAEFEEREMVFCQTVANAASIALRNAEILELLKAKTREIEKVQTEARDQLRSLKQYEEFFLGALDGMVALDQSGRIVFSNPKASELIGVDAALMKGTLFADFLIPEEKGAFETLLDEFVRGEARRSMDFSVSENRKPRRVMAISAGSLFGEKGMMLLTMRDVTEARLTQQQLAEAQRRLVQSEKRAAMAELAGATAHELNQPLTSVMTTLAMLRRLLAGMDREQHILSTMEQESERMAAIIRRMTKITNYSTKSYVGEAKIIDLENACLSDPEEDEN
ncbi:MAG: GAF domain-containing protein [Myxococcota bacterium]|nr:GAF domain-containing protein [Myxococcota bacterium]